MKIKLFISILAISVLLVGCLSDNEDHYNLDNQKLAEFPDPPEDPVIVPPENTAELCQDGIDNNDNDKIDCLDPECNSFWFCHPRAENTVELCSDGEDNDGDGLIDCGDVDGAEMDDECLIICEANVENSFNLCHDDLDNDGDGDTDCDDLECDVFCRDLEENTIQLCTDRLDNDIDDLVDCDDPDCDVICAAIREDTKEKCTDGIDNDFNDAADCGEVDGMPADPGCEYHCLDSELEDTQGLCSDGEDNDGDGKTDCGEDGNGPDEDCLFFCELEEGDNQKCSDGIDNDDDSFIDCDDEDCKRLIICEGEPENTDVKCQDGIDNDLDDGEEFGGIDCEDEDCKYRPICIQQDGVSIKQYKPTDDTLWLFKNGEFDENFMGPGAEFYGYNFGGSGVDTPLGQGNYSNDGLKLNSTSEFGFYLQLPFIGKDLNGAPLRDQMDFSEWINATMAFNLATEKRMYLKPMWQGTLTGEGSKYEKNLTDFTNADPEISEPEEPTEALDNVMREYKISMKEIYGNSTTAEKVVIPFQLWTVDYVSTFDFNGNKSDHRNYAGKTGALHLRDIFLYYEDDCFEVVGGELDGRVFCGYGD